MKLKAAVTKDAFQSLAKDAQAFYVESEGLMVLDVEESEGHALKDIAKMHKAMNAERARADNAERELIPLKKSIEGLDLAKARDAIAQVGDPTKAEKDIEQKIEAQVRQVREKLEAELKQRDALIAEQESSMASALIESEVTRICSGKDGKPIASAALLLPHVMKSARIVKDAQGKRAVQIVGADGQPQITKKPGSTALMGLDEFVPSLASIDAMKPAFFGTRATGDGAPIRRSTTITQGERDGAVANRHVELTERLKQANREAAGV